MLSGKKEASYANKIYLGRTFQFFRMYIFARQFPERVPKMIRCNFSLGSKGCNWKPVKCKCTLFSFRCDSREAASLRTIDGEKLNSHVHEPLHELDPKKCLYSYVMQWQRWGEIKRIRSFRSQIVIVIIAESNWNPNCRLPNQNAARGKQITKTTNRVLHALIPRSQPSNRRHDSVLRIPNNQYSQYLNCSVEDGTKTFSKPF